MDKYEIHRKIGSGNFAKVYLATNLQTKEEVALKLVDKKELKTPKASTRTRIEMANLRKLSGHQNIVTLHETFETRKHFGIVMEHVPGGELFEYVQKQEGIAESGAKEMFEEIVKGVKHCHSQGVAHRDLKLENILLDSSNKPKIVDFGFSKDITSRSLIASSVGSLLYSSPEIVEGKPYKGPECDVWSLGVILYTMLTATMPFDDGNMGDFIGNITNGNYPDPIGVSDSARDLISRMLDPNSRTRCTMDDILAHPWMSSVKTSSSSTSKNTSKRRSGVCYKSPESIRQALLKMNHCDCSCHKVDAARNAQNSAYSRHCPDCDDFQANDPEIMLRRQIRLSRNSSVSSGYGSEQCLQTPSPDDDKNTLKFDLYPILGRRSSAPRKSSASTVNNAAGSTRKASSQQRCSVPTRTRSRRPPREFEDDEIVFV